MKARQLIENAVSGVKAPNNVTGWTAAGARRQLSEFDPSQFTLYRSVLTTALFPDKSEKSGMRKLMDSILNCTSKEQASKVVRDTVVKQANKWGVDLKNIPQVETWIDLFPKQVVEESVKSLTSETSFARDAYERSARKLDLAKKKLQELS